MCGRFAFSTPLAVFVESFEGYDFSVLGEVHVEEAGYGRPRFNIAPTQEVPVIPNDGSRRVQFFRWGLVPRWADDPAIGNRMINARAESLAEKPSFRDAFKKRRCLMLSDGFYEWRTNPGTKTKTPIYVRLKNGRPFAFAGLWETWTPKVPKGAAMPADGDAPARSRKAAAKSRTSETPENYGPGHPLHTCTMITTDANSLMAQFHHRMPVILPREHYELWLSPDPLAPEILDPLLVPYPAGEMVAYPVSTFVNSPRNDSADCIVQVAPAIEQPGLGL